MSHGHGDKYPNPGLASPMVPMGGGNTPRKKDELSFGAEGDDEVGMMRQTASTGLTSAQAQAALEKYGPNQLPEKKVNPFLLFLSYLWGPMPIMIWCAIIIELAKASLTQEGWEDVGVLFTLQFANAIIGFIEEKNAGDAIAALKAKLAPMAHVCRDGSWRNMEARLLVPGDLIELAIGNIIPADSRLRDDAKPMSIDQAALTGESLPVDKHAGEKLLMGSAVKRGEAQAVVVKTGMNTFFGKAAGLIASVQHNGRLQLVLLRITASLLVLSFVLCAILFGVLYQRLKDVRDEKTFVGPPGRTVPPQPNNPLPIVEGARLPNKEPAPIVLPVLSIVIVILIASIPIAIEVVCTSTLAVGSHSMSNKGIIVARLSAIEELAGMNVLCSDKTGTLTKNKLELQQPVILGDAPPEDVVFYAALCSKRALGNQDAIDFCICDEKSNRGLLKDALLTRQKKLDDFVELDFTPFDPVSKRTQSLVQFPDGSKVEITKGAPMVILKMAHNMPAIEKTVKEYVQNLADRGFRALGVGMNLNPPGAPQKWEYLGILSIFDPPREDTKDTIAAAIANGILVKMVTGDHGAIARETCRTLGMGSEILNTSTLDNKDQSVEELDRIIMRVDGFAEVMPEHKFKIVERIRAMGHVCGMTGDGVNDAPALKRADVGIAVAGATDAARAASDLVLTEEGLSVIIDAIFESRKIFQRMRNYIIYRIACTIQLLVFFFLAILTIDVDNDYYYGGAYCGVLTRVEGVKLDKSTANLVPYNGNGICPRGNSPAFEPNTPNWDGFTSPGYTKGVLETAEDHLNPLAHGVAFTLPVISMVLITILNDGCMITISQDRVQPEKKPQKWELFEATIVAIMLGMVACASSLFLLVGCLHFNQRHPADGVKFMAARGKNYLTWYEVRTIIYLKVSVSDFLTLFSARTRTWFWERYLGGPLLIAACVALSISTIFALFWDSIFDASKLGESAFMEGLSRSDGAVVATWLYCILWWIIQDAAKVWTYWLLDLYSELGSWGLVYQAQMVYVFGGQRVERAGATKEVPNPAYQAQAKKGVSASDW